MQAFGEEAEGERPLERYRRRCGDNVSMIFEVGCLHRIYSCAS